MSKSVNAASTQPLVSILIITYNHEEYIREAIESALIQRCNFEFEIIIGDDFSKDKTREICEQYESEYKNIKLLPSVKNIGITENFIRTANKCNGKFIAMLEGDDYWTDPLKLQKQVDFLEKNPEFVLCFHNRNQCEGGIVSEKLHCDYGKEKHFIHEEILFAQIHTLTVVFRNILKEHPFPKQFSKLPLYDFALWAFLSLYGKAVYLDFVGATYRLHNKGYYSAGEPVKNLEKWMHCQIQIKKYFPERYHKSYNEFILMLNYMLLNELQKKKQLNKFRLQFILLIFRSIKYGDFQYIKYYFKLYKTKAKKSLKRILNLIVI